MELGGMVGMEGLVVGGSSEVASSSSCGFFPTSLASSEAETRAQKGIFANGNGFFKHGRSCGLEGHDLRTLKMARTSSSASLLRSSFPDAGEHMLSFSSPKSDALLLTSEGTLPFYHLPSSSSASSSSSSSSSTSTPAYFRTAGLSSGNTSLMNMHGVLAGVRGPFTPSQWMELEHQALIYKYIDANAPIPSNLLIPIRRSLYQSGFPPFSAGSQRSNPLGWGSFHLGFTGNADPEPGRCRRTDGKKWRCSRDAVADGKYCERHMNRGRHRSRKHVEGQNGHAAKAMPIIAPSPSAPAVPGGGSSNSLNISQQHIKNFQSSVADPSPAQFNRMLMSKENVNGGVPDSQGFSMLTSVNPKAMDNSFSISKQQNPFEGASSRTDFGLFSTDALLNTPRNSYSDHMELKDQQTQAHPLRHFFDDWPKNRSDRSTITWPEVEETHSNKTQLSISIPMSDFSSSSSSPNHEKLTLSPLKLSREFDPIPMGLSVGVLNEASQRQASWIPISWESSMGGPLGEVLTNTNNTTPKECGKNYSSSSLNLLTDGWDSSPRMVSSPTGVLQKTTFGSLSSSTGSSPRTESHKAHDEDLLGSNLVHASTIPSL
ncbi:Growth-regulating factor protein [Dioscorea alata]|uniref:Growth-regulating factor protein n=1 Tax=Dioscorea alata TaxID=55571 RepID=A0ACB7WNT4_DIOAL|nr:Growth-regulating factor protein [Dioscorea alata]